MPLITFATILLVLFTIELLEPVQIWSFSRSPQWLPKRAPSYFRLSTVR
ncbi:MAG: hypothetical protein R3F40_06320 [Candidatus Competibacteraceae bacterium]